MYKKITFFFIISLLYGVSASAAIKPDDAFYNNQWYLSKIKANTAWEKINSSPDIIIAVIDSGVDINHPDLKNNIWKNKKEIANNGVDDDNNGFIDDVSGWDFVNNVSDPKPKFNEGWTESGVSHGTIVSGIIAAQGNNSIGISGITWSAQIMPLKAISDKGEGKISDIIRAIDYAINNGANIINLSFMNLTYSSSMQAVIERANKAGVIVVAAAGNDQNGLGYNTIENPIYPACYDGNLIGDNMVIGVAATDALDQKTNFSSYGNRCIDISAPGISMFSTVFRGANIKNPEIIYDGYFSGTSMAAPQVSATLALIAQANPELNSQEIVSILLASVDNIEALNPDYSNQLGNGRLNVNKAVDLSKNKLYSQFGSIMLSPEKTLSTNNVINGPEIRTAGGYLIKDLDSNEFDGFNISASGDLDNDGYRELILTASSGNKSRVKVVSLDGQLKYEFQVYNKNILSGLELTVADILGDDDLEILVSSKENGDGNIKIFSSKGKFIKEMSVYDSNWKGEIVLAAGNIDGIGKDEIVLGFGAGVKSSLRFFNNEGKLIGAFYPYGENYSQGINLAVGNLNGRKNGNKAEIIVVPAKGQVAKVKIFNNYGEIINQFQAYNNNWLGGVNISTGDINNDGIEEIVFGAKEGAAPHVRVFDIKGKIMESFYAWEEGFTGGVKVIALKIKL